MTSATAKVKNADYFYAHKAVKLYYEPLDHRGTQWYADPLRINSPENDNLEPEKFWLHVYSEGYYGVFLINMLKSTAKSLSNRMLEL